MMRLALSSYSYPLLAVTTAEFEYEKAMVLT
jgi:hypothetical protein